MSSPAADPLFPAVRQDWPAAAQTSVRKPVPPSPFESLLAPREPLPNPLAQEPWTSSQFESTAVANGEENTPRAQEEAAQPSAVTSTSEEASEELEQAAANDTDQEQPSGEVELPSTLVQSLSGAAGIAVPVDAIVVTSAESPAPPANGATDAVMPTDAADSGATIASSALQIALAGEVGQQPAFAQQLGDTIEEIPSPERPERGQEEPAEMVAVNADTSPIGTDSAPNADSDQRQVKPREHSSDASQVLLAAATGAEPKPIDFRPDQVNQHSEPKGPANSSAAQPISSTAAADAPRIRLPAEILVPAGGIARPGAGSEIDAARLLHRVARAFAQAADQNGEVTIRLSPPELGALRLEVQVREGALTAHLQTETPEARTAILENLSALRERLADQGVRIERFDVDLMNRQPGGSPQQAFSDQRESPRTWRPASEAAATVKQPASVPHANKTSAGPGRLNVIV